MRLDLGPSLADAKALALARIDAEAEAARLRYITPGAGQALEYQATERDARAYLAAPQPADVLDFPFLAAEVAAVKSATGTMPDIGAVASELVEMAGAWGRVGAAIKHLRREAKLRIAAATTHNEIRAAAAVDWPAP